MDIDSFDPLLFATTHAHDGPHPIENIGSGKMLDQNGRLWQLARWDDDLTQMEERDVWMEPNLFPIKVYYRVDGPHAPRAMPFEANVRFTQDVDVLFRCRSPGECRIQMGHFLRAILKFDFGKDPFLSISTMLPVHEQRAFSCLARRFRYASTCAWSDDVNENERIMLSIMRKDQPGFLSRCIADSGMCKASLGRMLLEATDGGRLYRGHVCCRLLGEMGAVIRLEDAVKVIAEDEYHAGVYVHRTSKKCERVYAGFDCFLVLDPASELQMLRDSGMNLGPVGQQWQAPFWRFMDDGGFDTVYLAFSSSVVPPSDGWYEVLYYPGEGSPTIQIAPVKVEDLIDSGTQTRGPILDKSEVRRRINSVFSRPPQWTPSTAHHPSI